MVEKYDKYLIEDLRRINSRYYLIKIHGKSFIWDFYDLRDFRNYYPFEVFYPKKNTWKIYEITGEELNYSSKIQIGFMVQRPFTFWLESSLFFIGLISTVNLVISLLILTVMFLFTIMGLNKINRISVKQKPQYILKVAKLEKISLWERKIKPIIVIIVFLLILIISLFSLIVLGFSTMYAVLSFFGLGVIFIGTMWNHNYVPNINVKYQIIEKKEN
ncbi:hypothetical protein [Enterococcus sp. AZ050]|uniref:hypothetical protein n=1 Tax=Enterococcus sp. AZ050 TaxID=2774696 RepID=UPI003F25BC55